MSPSFGEQAKNGLTTKLAGLPLYIWGGGFVVAFYAYKKWKSSKAGPTVNTGYVAPQGIGSEGGPTGNIPLIPSSGSVSGINTSNFLAGTLSAQDWISQGTAYLASLGYDGTKANQYLSSFTTGQSPTGEASKYVNLALNQFGAPQGIQTYTGNTSTPTLVRFIAGRVNPDYGAFPEYVDDQGHMSARSNGGIYAQYSDGTLQWISQPRELIQLEKSHPELADQSGNFVTVLPYDDPIWHNVTNGPGISYHLTPAQLQDTGIYF